MGPLDRLRAANGDGGMLGRVREDGRLLVAVAAGAILVLAWIGWAIYVTSSDGARAGLGVVIAWPAMLAALAIVSLPFIGVFLLIRYLARGGAADAAEAGEEDEDSEEEPEEDSEEEESEDEPEAEASKAG